MACPDPASFCRLRTSHRPAQTQARTLCPLDKREFVDAVTNHQGQPQGREKPGHRVWRSDGLGLEAPLALTLRPHPITTSWPNSGRLRFCKNVLLVASRGRPTPLSSAGQEGTRWPLWTQPPGKEPWRGPQLCPRRVGPTPQSPQQPVNAFPAFHRL